MQKVIKISKGQYYNISIFLQRRFPESLLKELRLVPVSIALRTSKIDDESVY
jgi:hypothetical protein